MEAFLDLHTLLGSQSSSLNVDDIMEDDDMSIPDSNDDQLLIGRQHAQLQRYLSSVPYQCESPEEMDEKLEVIIDKIGVCAETKDWLVLSSWNGALHWCVETHSIELAESTLLFCQLAAHALSYFKTSASQVM